MNPLQRLRPQRVARNVNQLHDQQTTFGEQLSDGLARFGGSWTFILLFGAALALWIGLNSLQLLFTAFDPYPYIFLNLILSCLAAIQAPVIMMSQNRQAARDRLAAELDYACNMKAEIEVEQLHAKLDLLREKQWVDLVELQQHQIMLLNQILEDRGLRGIVPPTQPSVGRPAPLHDGRAGANGARQRANVPSEQLADSSTHDSTGRHHRRPRIVDGRCQARSDASQADTTGADG